MTPQQHVTALANLSARNHWTPQSLDHAVWARRVSRWQYRAGHGNAWKSRERYWTRRCAEIIERGF